MIPQITIDKILEKAEIVSIIGNDITLKKKGSNFVGSCPFHDEKTASLTVSPSKKIFSCFGCGAKGGVANYIMKRKGLNYIESLRYIAEIIKIEIIEDAQTPEQEAIRIQRNIQKDINQCAQDYFSKSMKASDEARLYISSRTDDVTITKFNLGFAPKSKNNLLNYLHAAGYSTEDVFTAGLISKSEKTNSYYDFFQNRIIFPTYNTSGVLIGFSGRKLPDDNNSDKYYNLKDTPLFHKKDVIYGLKESLQMIINKDTAILVEGPIDVLRMHQLGFSNTISSQGTNVTKEHLDIIKTKCQGIHILFDGDPAGLNATKKVAIMAISIGLFVKVSFLPDKKDPGDMWESNEEAKEWLSKNTIEFIEYYSDHLIHAAATDPFLKNDAITEISKLIICYHPDLRKVIIDNISDTKRLKPKLINDRIASLTKDTDFIDSEDKPFELPKHVNTAEYFKYGFYEDQNEYFFDVRTYSEKVSNFVMQPLFHVDSVYDSKRIYELVNRFNFRSVVNFDMQEMTSLQSFSKNIEGKGNFLFWGTAGQFAKLKIKLYEKTRTCFEIRSMGWQKEGFFAWSNGITTDKGFIPIDEHGVIEFKERAFFIPAFSSIYIHDKGIFLDERKFQYKKHEIKLADWSQKFINVFGDNAKIGIAFWIATLFRDHILYIFNNFPILNLFGPKSSGKSQMARSLASLFGPAQNAFNIHNGTKAGLAEHLQQFANAFAWIDEYKNNLDYEKVETLKSIYDSVGRSRMNMDKGKKKESTMVISGVILSGQEMPTADVALFSRVIFCLFNQTVFSDEAKLRYEDLKEIENDGMSHLSHEILQHREYFVKNFMTIYSAEMSEFNEIFRNIPLEDRIQRSFVTILAAFKTISTILPVFPFTYEDIKGIAVKMINNQNSQIGMSDELGQFWSYLESMFDENILIDNWHFKIEICESLNLANQSIVFNCKRPILKFKYNSIYSLYAQQARKQGNKPLPSDTLKYYLSNQKNYIGVQSSTSFTEIKLDLITKTPVKNRQITTSLCFYYTGKPVNLSREAVDPFASDSLSNNNDLFKDEHPF